MMQIWLMNKFVGILQLGKSFSVVLYSGHCSFLLLSLGIPVFRVYQFIFYFLEACKIMCMLLVGVLIDSTMKNSSNKNLYTERVLVKL